VKKDDKAIGSKGHKKEDVKEEPIASVSDTPKLDSSSTINSTILFDDNKNVPTPITSPSPTTEDKQEIKEPTDIKNMPDSENVEGVSNNVSSVSSGDKILLQKEQEVDINKKKTRTRRNKTHCKGTKRNRGERTRRKD